MMDAGISGDARCEGLYKQAQRAYADPAPAMRSAGASHGQEMLPTELEAMIAEVGRTPRRRTTVYGVPQQEHSVG